jgi:hypothetical protein
MMNWKSFIRPLDVLPLWARVLVVVLAAALAVLLLFFVSGGEGAPVLEPPPSKWDTHLLELDRQALESAYHDQMKLLFSVWLKDDVKALERVTNGFRIARHAYAAAASRIEKREQELQLQR